MRNFAISRAAGALRGALLAAAVLAATGSSSSNETRNDGNYYGAQVGTYDENGRPIQPGGGAAGEYHCHEESSERYTASVCRPDPAACEAERQAAEAEGLSAGACVPTRPVACFQLANEADPASTWCSASIEDCELWRRIDYDKNGITGHPCQWR